MSEHVVGRFNRVSPSPGKGSAVAYMLCPASDPDFITTPNNVLTIPLSAITLSTTAPNATSTAGMRKHTIEFVFFGLALSITL